MLTGVRRSIMREISHNYWAEINGDADALNPELKIAMQKLYGRKGFDFGKIRNRFNSEDRESHCNPDGYGSYTSPSGNYLNMMPFRAETVEKNKELAERCRYLADTIAGEMFFPAHKSNCKTINGARGQSKDINDMLYLTLENIKRYYDGESDDYPLKRYMENYGFFFDRFDSFDEYIEYNFLQDWEILPKKFPTTSDELVEFWEKSVDFLEARLKRIYDHALENDLFRVRPTAPFAIEIIPPRNAGRQTVLSHFTDAPDSDL